MKKNPALLILALIMIVNALSYGTIIPLLYPYAARFGINATGLGFLFASFSFFQFLATPIMGRLSDKYGRKPLLLLSLLGTSLSLALFASAGSALMLFVSRILDGITGGNISVAQAVIADSLEGEDRAKGFGMLGAAFGIGFVAGPAIGGVLSQFGLTTPFWFASGLALVGTILGLFMLPETLKKSQRVKAHHEPLIDLGKLVRALGIPAIGTILFITLLSTIGHQVVIIGFQSYSVDILKLNATQIGMIFAIIGVISVLMQAVVLGKLLSWFKKSRLLLISITLSAISCFFFWTNPNVFWFVLSSMFYSAGVAPQMPVISGLISERTRAEDQGGMLGINASYMSLGQIIGPILAGLVAQRSISLVFMLSGLIFIGSVFFMRFSKPARRLADI